MQPPDTRHGAGVGKLPGRASTHPPALLVPKPEAGKPTPLPHSAAAGKQVVLGGSEKPAHRSKEVRDPQHTAGLTCDGMAPKSFIGTRTHACLQEFFFSFNHSL